MDVGMLLMHQNETEKITPHWKCVGKGQKHLVDVHWEANEK